MHHTCHKTCHPEENVVLRGDEDAKRTEVVHQVGEDEARQSADEERRSKEPTTASSRIGSDRGKDLKEYREKEESKHHPIGAGEGPKEAPIQELGVLPI